MCFGQCVPLKNTLVESSFRRIIFSANVSGTKEIGSSDKIPVEGAWIMKEKSMVGVDGRAINLVQKRPAEGVL